MHTKRVKGYPYDEERQKEELVLKTYEYDMPFNYPNVTLWRKKMSGEEFHGVELATRNEGSQCARLREVDPGKWTPMRVTFVVPPEAATAAYLITVSDMAPDEEIWFADAFAGQVPDDWDEHDEIPTGAINLIANPAFAGKTAPPPGWKLDSPAAVSFTGGFMPPAGWKTDLSGIGTAVPDTKDVEGRRGILLKGADVALYTEFPVEPGQRLVYSLWVKSTNRLPNSVCLSNRWKSRQGSMLSDNAGDCIIIEEEDPIVRVAVIGSACTPPGYVTLEAEPCEEFYHRGDMVRCTAPVRFRQNNLWGMHLRIDQWRALVQGDFGNEDIPENFIRAIPALKDACVKSHYSEFPFAGMSCAIFEIPKSRKVTIMGGSESPTWLTDNCPNDDHYSFRTIRTTVAVSDEKRL